jgi:hypothetical protein
LRRWQSALVLAATAFGFAVSFVLLRRVIGSSSPWLGLLLMFYFLGLIKIAEPLLLLRVPPPLREVRTAEAESAIYRNLRVPSFGRLLKNTPLRFLNTAVYLPHGRSNLGRLLRLAEAAEAAHLWAAVLFLPYIAYVWWSGQRGVATFFLVIQILFNIYPILHLRLVRARLARLERRRPRAPAPLSAMDRG